MREQIEELKRDHQKIEAMPLFAKPAAAERLIGSMLHVIDQLSEEIDQLRRAQGHGS